MIDRESALLVEALGQVEIRLNGLLKEREEVTRALVLTLLSGEHLYLVGPPGTGKSLLIRLVASFFPRLVYFERLLHQDSDRASLTRSPLLPVGLSDGGIVFLDEILRAPKSLLLTLLSFLNERIWHDPEPRPAELLSLFAASNAHPSQADHLEAFFDRFALRCFVEPVRRFESFVDILGESPEKSIGNGGEEGEGGLVFGFTGEDFRNLHRAIHRNVPLSRGIPEALWELRGRLGREGINLSDRRWKMVVKVLKAIAVQEGNPKVQTGHLASLLPVLWTYPPEIRTIRRVLSEVV